MNRHLGASWLSLTVLISLMVSGCLATEQPAKPTAVIEAPDSGIAGVLFNLSAANSASKRDPIVEYLWDFGDSRGSTGEKVKHIYRQEGVFTIRLVVVTDEGGAHSTTHVVEILMPNTPPVAIIEGPDSGEVGRNLTFDAKHSFDNDGDMLTYLWNFGDGATSIEKRYGHVFAEPDTYKVKLTITDSRETTAVATLMVTINLRQYRVNWDILHQPLIDEDFHLEQTQDATHPQDLPSNVTSVMANLTWTDDSALIPFTEDTFTLEVDGTDGFLQTSQENDGAIQLIFDPINDEPSGIIYIEAYDLSDLYQRLAVLISGPTGQGSWVTTVTLNQALPDLPDTDTGNDYHLELDLIRYRARVTEVQG